MLQRNIVKAKEFINNSVTKVRDMSRNQVSVTSASRSPLTQPRQLPWLLFAREIWRNPRTMGAACPSSPRLAKMMAHLVPEDQSVVVELGAGTGIITKALLQRGIAPERLVSVEISKTLANFLQQHYPQVRVINGDARHLSDLLGSDCQRVNTIVSGLPFRSLPRAIGRDIVKQIEEILPVGGLLIQFTYDLSGRATYLPHHFKRVSVRLVWNNLPPARIDVYQKG